MSLYDQENFIKEIHSFEKLTTDELEMVLYIQHPI